MFLRAYTLVLKVTILNCMFLRKSSINCYKNIFKKSIFETSLLKNYNIGIN